MDSDPDNSIHQYLACPTDSQQQKSSRTYPDTGQGTMPLCSGASVLSEGGEEVDVGWCVSGVGGVGGVGGKPRVA